MALTTKTIRDGNGDTFTGGMNDLGGGLGIVPAPQLTHGAALVSASNPLPTVYTPRTGQVVDESGNVLTVKQKSATITASGATAFIAAVASRKIRVLGYRVQALGTASSYVSVTFLDTAAAQVTNSPQWDFAAREGVCVESTWGFEFETTSGLGLQINLSAASSVRATVLYCEVP